MNWLPTLASAIHATLGPTPADAARRQALADLAKDLSDTCDTVAPFAPAPELVYLGLDSWALTWCRAERTLSLGITWQLTPVLRMSHSGITHRIEHPGDELRRSVLAFFEAKG